MVFLSKYFIPAVDKDGRSLGNFDPESLRLVGPADVIVFLKGDVAYAVDLRTKEVIAWGKDHASVIQSAINSTPAKGTVVFLDEFTITSPITVKSDITLVGGRFVQKMDNEPIFKSPATSWDDAIENVKFIGMEFDVDSSVTTSDAGIGLGYVKSVVVTYCRFLNGIGSGVYASLLLQPVEKAWILFNKAYGPSDKSAFIVTISGSDRSSYVYAIGNYAEDFGDTGLGVLNTDNGAVVGNVTIKGANKRGGIIDLSGSTNLLVSNNVAILDYTDDTRYGIYARTYTPSGGTEQTSYNINMINNYIEAYIGVNVYDKCENSVIAHNRIKAYHRGIYINSSYVNVFGNIVEQVGKTPEAGDNGIHLDAGTNDILHCLIKNNYVKGFYYAVVEDARVDSADYNIIEGNDAEGYGDGKYYINNGGHSYIDEEIYSSLPSDGFAVEGKPITYYDGTNYYLAVWNGSAWVKVQLA